jgi:hypothetical protein
MPALHTYDRVDDLHRWYAELDAPDPRPHLVGFAGDAALVLIGLRPFGPGAYENPLIEAMALALPLGADRVSLAMPGRAWSMDDPVVPVTEDGDLRQRVLTQVTVDGHGHAPTEVTMRLHPFDVVGDDRLAWHEALDPGPGEGWIADAMACMVAGRHDIGRDAEPDAITEQAVRLVLLGHEVLHPDPAAVRGAG